MGFRVLPAAPSEQILTMFPATVTVGMHLLKVGDVDVTGAWVIIMLFEASNASSHAYNMGSALRARHPEARHRR